MPVTTITPTSNGVVSEAEAIKNPNPRFHAIIPRDMCFRFHVHTNYKPPPEIDWQNLDFTEEEIKWMS